MSSRISNAVSQNQKTPTSYHTRMLLLSIVVAIIMTIFHVQLANFIFKDRQDFWRSGSPSYGVAGRSIIEQNMLSLDQESPTATRPPLYPIFIAALLLVSEGPEIIIIAQSILAGITFGLLTAVAYKYTRNTWPMLPIIFLFAAIKFIAFDNIVQHETVLFTTLICIGALIFTSEAEQHSAKKVMGLGFILGLAALTRPLAPAVLIVAVLWFGWLLVNKVPFYAAFKKILLFACIFYLILLPWGLRNLISIGKYTLTSTTSGINLWKGNNPATHDIYPALEIDKLDSLIYEVPTESGWWNDLHSLSPLSQVSQDEYLFALGKRYILEHPLHFLKMGGIKLLSLWTPQNVPTFEGDVVWTPTGAEITNIKPYYDDMLPTLLLYILAILGMWLRRHSPFVFYLVTWAIALSAVHAVTFAESRFRWPINMLMLPMAAVGLNFIFKKSITIFQRSLFAGN